MSNPLKINVDDIVLWVVKHEPVHLRARKIKEVYKRGTKIKKGRDVVTALDPVKFMFVSEDAYFYHVKMLLEVAELHGVQYKNFTKHTEWRTREQMTKHEWLRFYLNPDVLTEENVQSIPIERCHAMLSELQQWFNARDLPKEEGGTALYSCCIIAYLDQIRFLALRSMKPECIDFYNNLVDGYTSAMVDCESCKQKNRKAARDAKYGVVRKAN